MKTKATPLRNTFVEAMSRAAIAVTVRVAPVARFCATGRFA